MNTEKRRNLYPGLTTEKAIKDAQIYFSGRRHQNHGSFPRDSVMLGSQKRGLYECLVAIPDGTWSANGKSVAIYTHGQPEELHDTQLVVAISDKEALFLDRSGKLGTYAAGERRVFDEREEANQLTALENILAQVFDDTSAVAHVTETSEAVYPA